MIEQKSHRTWKSRTLIAATATVAAIGLALGGGVAANALVDPNIHSNNEPDFNGTIGGLAATNVYRMTFTGVSGALLTVDNNNKVNNGLVNTWQRTIESHTEIVGVAGGVVQANQEWEFIPAAAHTNSVYVGGYFRSRESGLCLQVQGALTTPGSRVSQYTCISGATNEMWKVNASNHLQSMMPGTSLELNAGISFGDHCAFSNKNGGAPLIVVEASATNPCADITIAAENYRFASNQVTPSTQLDLTDSASYKCLNGYQVAVGEVWQDTTAVDISSGPVGNSAGAVGTEPNGLRNPKLAFTASYGGANSMSTITQVFFFRLPSTSANVYVPQPIGMIG